MTIHPTNCTCDAYACQLRAKGIGYSSTTSPTMRTKRTFRPRANCSWEAGVAGEQRPGGFFSPYVGERSLRRVHVKEAGERRREISEARRAAHAGASPKE